MSAVNNLKKADNAERNYYVQETFKEAQIEPHKWNSIFNFDSMDKLQEQQRNIRSWILTKVTRLLNYHKYEIILVESNNIVAEHRKTVKIVFF